MPRVYSLLILGMLTVLGLSGCGGGGTPPDLASWVAPATGVTTHIVFHSYRKGNGDVFIMAPDGSGQQDLTVSPPGNAFDGEAALSWDGLHVAFVSNRKGPTETFVMDATGLNVRRLTFNATPGGNYEPAWSPNGARIAFVHYKSNSLSNIWIINADSSGPMRISSGGDTYSDVYPCWLPDGSGLVFSSDRKDGTYQIYRMKADGSGVTRLSFGGIMDIEPSCAPDSTRIAFRSNRKGGGVFTMKLDGTDMRRVPNTAANADHPCWGPGGTVLAFTQPPPGIGAQQIYKINLDGSGKTRLTHTKYNEQWPSWGRAAD